MLDANVLLPPRLSDVIFDLSCAGLFSAKWTDAIELEFLRNWSVILAAARRKAFQSTGNRVIAEPADDHLMAVKRLRCFQHAIPEYQVFGYDDESVVKQVPAAVHQGDRHVAAAAITLLKYVNECSVTDKVFIVSANLKHLAVNDMRAIGIEVLGPGAFIDLLFAAAAEKVDASLKKSLADLKTPPLTKADLLAVLRLHGAQAVVRHYAKAWNVPLAPASQRRPARL